MIETAVIPAAGYGSRMKPLTMVIPKEMFPLGNLPVIEHTIRELIFSGIKRICIVIRKDKEVIKEYLDGRKKLYKNVEFHFSRQKMPLGLGDAIRRAKDFIADETFLMAIPDQLLLSEIPAAMQLLEAGKKREGIWNSLVKIPRKERVFFKGARPFKYRKLDGDSYAIEDISIQENSLVRGFGRTIFLPEALEYMTEAYKETKSGEVDLFKSFQAMKDRFPLYGVILKGKPCDIGTWEGYHYYQPLIRKYLNFRGKVL